MKIAVVGAGMWGKNIVRTLHELGSLACVVDSHEENRNALAAQYRVPTFSSLVEVDPGSFQGVAIATHAPTHASIAFEAIRAGKHAFVEKPIALTSRDAEMLHLEATEAGVCLMAGHLLLYQPAVQFLKSAIDDGLVGRLRSVHIRRANLGRARDVEDVLWSLGVHDVAVVMYLVDSEPKQTIASGDAFLNPEIADDTYVHIRFESGAKAHIHSSWLFPELRRETIVIGDRAMLVYDELNQKVTLHKKFIDAELRNLDEGSEVIFEGHAQPLTLEMQEFIECSQTGRTPRSDGVSAIRVTKVLEQASECMQ
ncbi:Gfo/Idh/MocA family oxidoreductase [Kamptonema cortianum]|nr:Gfo/Idh/MocA family oxidoreductase [Geitlerinema splendidum]MDK3155258.1 Gfo/Idh/MocA family oxidoreductase [Kamptonema cortianum]